MDAHLMSQEVTRTRGRPRKGTERDGDKLIDAALDAFAEHGFDKASLRSIAAAANVDVALISYRYGSKLELWKAVIQAFSKEMASLATMRTYPDDLSASSRLEIAIEQLITVACRKPQFAKFIVKELGSAEQSGRFELLHRELAEPTRRVLVPLIEAACREAGTGKFDANFAFFAALGAMAVSLATRKFIARFTPVAADDGQMRQQLSTIMRAMLCPQVMA
jgi:AcrR family transcriptional regulator